jgi:hypothetical protein
MVSARMCECLWRFSKEFPPDLSVEARMPPNTHRPRCTLRLYPTFNHTWLPPRPLLQFD